MKCLRFGIHVGSEVHRQYYWTVKRCFCTNNRNMKLFPVWSKCSSLQGTWTPELWTFLTRRSGFVIVGVAADGFQQTAKGRKFNFLFELHVLHQAARCIKTKTVHNLMKNKHTSTQPETGTQTKASSSPFSLHSDVNIPFIFGPQRLARFHDVAALLGLICFCCPPLCHSISIRAVLARGRELGCVIWFRAEREHLSYKASAASIPQASWKNPRPAVGRLLLRPRTSKPANLQSKPSQD